MDLAGCLPKDKFDLEAIDRANGVGFPTLNPVLPELLLWLQDLNWPVARVMADLLITAGPELVPAMRSALVSGDSIWKHNLLTELCPKLRTEILQELAPDIARLADDPTEGDRKETVDLAAKAIIKSIDLAG